MAESFAGALAGALERDWRSIARLEQLPPPGDWTIWLVMAGRGFGKTRTGAEFIGEEARAGVSRIALVGPTAGDVRDTMVEGESGILACSPDWCRPVYEPSRRRLSWPNGAIATLYSADEPDRLRGPQHQLAWFDELGAIRYAEAFDQLMFGLRLGTHPRCLVTTTPRPTKLIRGLVARPDVVITRGSTFANAKNLAPAFLDQILRRYQGTRLAKQEVEGQLLTDVAGALWRSEVLERPGFRIGFAGDQRQIVVAIDPAVTSGEGADETGIIVAGKDSDGHAFIIDDLSGRMAPFEWAQTAVRAYRQYQADRIIAEVNNGGDLVESTLRMVDSNVSFASVRASRGKAVRAEPVAALYEQGRVHHIGELPQLEEQMLAFTADFDRQRAGYSPDRVDALVWALSYLLIEPPVTTHIWTLL